ncbi:hypothetical protein [Cellulomonas sp. ICMP 17802]|uniref:hypothetical protein n=1 Tax=Cellulomonas sp. ICMP 17802 TaxID=3239199 RepID=UPI00351AF52C
MTSPFPPTGAPEPPGEPVGRRRGWTVALAVLLVVAIGVIVYLVVQRDDGGSTPVASPSSSSSPSATPSPSASESSEPTAAAGCAPNDEAVPAGADVVTVIDVDGDGRPDQAWLSASDTRRFGITTASGATFSAAIDSASPIAASAVVNRVQADQIPIALVDLGREALVYSLAGCAVTPVLNAGGEPYRFDRGFGDQGTGVGCSSDAGTLRLAGLDAVADAAGTYTVTRTFVDLDADGRHATNGSPEQVATGAAADDPVVRTAQEVSCGDLVAGSDAGPVEPVAP